MKNQPSDLFHQDHSDEEIEQAFSWMATEDFPFDVLTNNTDRMSQYFRNRKVPSNIRLGVTIRDRKTGLQNIKRLQKIDSGKRHIYIHPSFSGFKEKDSLDGIDVVTL